MNIINLIFDHTPLNMITLSYMDAEHFFTYLFYIILVDLIIKVTTFNSSYLGLFWIIAYFPYKIVF